MKWYASLSLLIIFSGCLTTEALKCHVCGYIEGITDEYVGFIPPGLTDFLDVSCKDGNTPAANFSSDCGPPSQNETMTCGKTHSNIAIPISNVEDLNLDITIRGCLSVPKDGVDTCKGYTLKDVIDDEELGFEIPDVCVSICTCSKELCDAKTEDACGNGGGGGEGGSGGGGGGSVAVRSSIWILAIAVLFTKLGLLN